MREIKFRAWDEKRKLITVFDLREIYADCYGNVGFLQNAPHQNEKDCWGDFELMQFTGLKDKNGKEIYEGDIIDWHGDKGIVIYSDNAFVVKCTDGFLDDYFSEWEIVGNIYENPELLKANE